MAYLCSNPLPIRHAFNFGWDADNVAATSGTIMRVIHGSK